MLIEKATTGSSAQGNVFWDHYSIACQKGLSLILSIWPGKDLFGCICHFAHFAHSCLKPIWDVKIISRVEAHAGFYLALNLALHPKLHEWPQHLSFSCWFSEGVYLRHSFCFSSGEGQSLRGLQSDMYNIHRHIHCICLRLLIHDLDSLDTYCSLAPKFSFLLFVCTSIPTNILNGTKVWTNATTDVFIFRRLTKDAWLCNIQIDPSITT